MDQEKSSANSGVNSNDVSEHINIASQEPQKSQDDKKLTHDGKVPAIISLVSLITAFIFCIASYLFFLEDHYRNLIMLGSLVVATPVILLTIILGIIAAVRYARRKKNPKYVLKPARRALNIASIISMIAAPIAIFSFWPIADELARYNDYLPTAHAAQVTSPES